MAKKEITEPKELIDLSNPNLKQYKGKYDNEVEAQPYIPFTWK